MERFTRDTLPNLLRRFKEHQSGSAKCKYTRSFKPIDMAQVWCFQADKSHVLKVENFIKKLSRQQKQEIVENPKSLMYYLKQKKIT